ncbi:tyrosine-type recombinase/integrase [Albidovulum sediminicola]|uniref:Tyrosine-type recombinase/integrase n=1 Tax=Albidovulum sediminicola TaxID=2984331 RepID=A0ABT2YX46_9RHOB|nr:tyrosine-type recombinase/integrase [Defluviimonas sp. WL0075]MCV2863332.1 tyrosine-type recombinase/integrase [Defluviimonas sp. WL0075]
MKHVERTKSGSFQYRRRVPRDVAAIITKREFKRKLGDSEREALAAYPRYHAQVEREIADAKLRLAGAVAASQPGASEREAYAEALRRRADLISAGVSEEGLALTADSMADAYPQDEWEPVGVPPVEHHTINLLRLGPDRYKAPEPNLQDALRLYIAEKLGDEGRSDSRTVGRLHRVVGIAVEALGRNPLMTSLTREDARKVRDRMLGRVKSNGEKLSFASVKREMTTLKAVINFGIAEFDLPETTRNPFNKLDLGASDNDEAESEKRHPFPAKVLKSVCERVRESASPELALIWRLLEGTGCRLAEITGLRVDDVKLTGDIGAQFPHIRVAWHENRRVKTKASIRHVPVVGDALEAAKVALAVAREGTMLFPSYGRKGGPTAASAALMKHVRLVTTDPKLVVNSLRHNMKDNFILAEIPSLDQNLILGHALGGVGDRVYGGSLAKLRKTTRAMKKALGIPLSDADMRQTSEETREGET